MKVEKRKLSNVVVIYSELHLKNPNSPLLLVIWCLWKFEQDMMAKAKQDVVYVSINNSIITTITTITITITVVFVSLL